MTLLNCHNHKSLGINGEYLPTERDNPISSRENREKSEDRLAGALRFCARLSRSRRSQLYVIEAGDFVKIGVAFNVVKRLNEMQVGCPYKLQLLAWVDCEDAYAAESAVHRHLQGCHYRGEWFTAGKDQIDEALLLIKGL